MSINATLIGQMITFLVFVFITMKYIWPLFMKVLNERAKKIADGLAAAQKGHRELEIAEHKMRDILAKAKQDAAKIVEDANKRAHSIVDESQQKARSEGERILANAQAEIEQEVNAAREALRKEVAKLAVAGAEKVLQRNITDNDADRMVDELIAEL
tara:strand:+ start:9268 stop:9738 length:471 start_codon:yes stop_codon:yes gene_type:complete